MLVSLYSNVNKLFRRFKFLLRNISHTSSMAKSKFEYVKEFERNDMLLPNCWIVVRVDGKAFHKFAEKHNFERPNDIRSLNLMNRAAMGVMKEFYDVILTFGQSDEYSFVFKKDTQVYNRRSSKIASTVTSLFTSMYVFHWKKHFDIELKYPPAFDGRCVLYPTDENLKDYLSWRQADVHINNLHNTTFWNLVQKSNMTTTEADERLRGTVSSDKNEILFSQFNINYNNELPIFRKGSILLRKEMLNPHRVNHYQRVIIDIHEDMIKEKFWQDHWELLENEKPQKYDNPNALTNLVEEQFKKPLLK